MKPIKWQYTPQSVQKDVPALRWLIGLSSIMLILDLYYLWQSISLLTPTQPLNLTLLLGITLATVFVILITLGSLVRWYTNKHTEYQIKNDLLYINHQSIRLTKSVLFKPIPEPGFTRILLLHQWHHPLFATQIKVPKKESDQVIQMLKAYCTPCNTKQIRIQYLLLISAFALSILTALYALAILLAKAIRYGIIPLP